MRVATSGPEQLIERRRKDAAIRAAGPTRPERVPREPAPPIPARPPWLIPGPADGVSYSQQEVATLCKVRVKTVQNWRVRGVCVHGRQVRLVTMYAGRKGEVSPGALCAFLGEANGLEVKIRA